MSQLTTARIRTCSLSWLVCGWLAWTMQVSSAQIRPIQLEPSSAPVGTSPTQPAEAAGAPADSGVVDQESNEAWLQQVARRQQQLASDTDQTPAQKEQLAKAYEAVVRDLQGAQKARQRWTELAASAAAAPAALEAAKARKQELEIKQPLFDQALDELSYEELERQSSALGAELKTVTAERTALVDSIAQREKRRKELPQLISESKAKLEQFATQSPTSAEPTATSSSEEAIQLAREATRRLLREQQQSYEAEQELYEAEGMLLPLKLEIAQANERRLQERLRLINEQLDKRRANRIQGTYNTARRLTAVASPELADFGKTLLARIQKWMELTSQQAALQDELTEARELFTSWSERRKQMMARVELEPGNNGVNNVISGFNSWVGLMLRKQRGELPDPQVLSSNIRSYQQQLQSAESLLFDIEDAHQKIRQLQDGLDRNAASELSLDSTEKSTDARLLDFTTDLLRSMTQDVNEYQDDLYALADIRENTIRLTNEYRDFIDKHVLWIRSTEPLTIADWRTGVEAVRWLGDLRNWQAVGRLLGRDMQQRPVWYALLLTVIVAVFLNHSRLRRQLHDMASKSDKNSCVDFRLTTRGLFLTSLLTVPLPLLMFFFYWRLSRAAGEADRLQVGDEFPLALADGLWLAAVVFIPLEISRQLCRPGGLGIKHFGWNENAATRLRTNLRWLIDFCVPLTLFVGIFHNHEVERWEASFGRAAFILLLPMLSIFFARVLAPHTGVVSGFLQSNRGGWLDRLSWLWYPAHLIYPLALAAVSYVGYHYTAQRIAAHMVSTLWLVVLLTITYHMLMRWLVISRRRLMLAQARQRLEEAARREPTAENTLAVEEPRVNLVAINEQTKRLVTSLIVAVGLVMLFVIWSDVLPAVALLDGIRLWPLYGTITPDTFSITLANVLLVIPLIVLFVIAGRNVPGLLEIALLQNLPLSNAARYAITTLSRYTIFALGIIVVFSMIGVQWNSIQWLVAALGVGLGFGLQEIFANFVSGIILLFEQPIRVGDIISIDGTTGSVSKIRMRATTIVNWDRQELIVPNKDLITGKLLNWTLTDSTNRLVINVGLAYGSDTHRACELIRQVCCEHPHVLREPAPSVTFESFGDNGLKLVVRAFLDSLENRLLTMHELHHGIYQELNRAQIEIAFPQRDLHIRTLPEKWNRWLDKQS